MTKPNKLAKNAVNPTVITDIETLIQGNVEVTKDDLLAIATSAFEEKLREAIEKNRSQIEAKNKKVTADNKAIKKKAQVLAESQAKKTAPAEEALKALGFDIEITTSSNTGNETVDVSMTVIAINNNTYRRDSIDSATTKIPFTDEMLKLVKSMKSTEKELLELSAYGVELLRSLSDIGSHERKAKAELAKQLINSKGAAGKELVEKLVNLQSSIVPKALR